ncbi:hypothetical protein L484_009783 [Morus notabilis]|uniref:Uncharacterized protein n=1 Tax=Morus notabilis TaxID=981085 RepID=W9SHA9_9ROSA|nr:hypothetical protein L484_009783 [Morus notabilis]
MKSYIDFHQYGNIWTKPSINRRPRTKLSLLMAAANARRDFEGSATWVGWRLKSLASSKETLGFF